MAVSILMYGCVIHPFGHPKYINFLKPILFMARDSSSGFPTGVSHISLRPQEIQPREWEKKNKWTIWSYVSSKCKKGSFVTLFWTAFHAFCRLLRAYIFCETPTKATRNVNSSLTVFLTASSCRPLSTASLFSLHQLTLSGFLCQLTFSPRLLVLSEISSSGLCLFSRQNKGIVCLACHPYSVTDAPHGC